MILVNVMFVPEKTFSGSGFFMKDGGSKHINKTEKKYIQLLMKSIIIRNI